MKALIYAAVILSTLCSVFLLVSGIILIQSGGILPATQLFVTSICMLCAALILSVPLFVSLAVSISHLFDKTNKK
ncbi:MAG: hypothetical protein IJF14_02170 [Clostridia bacterium]|nr:hypothetical protein [Clostridia bacterium]